MATVLRSHSRSSAKHSEPFAEAKHTRSKHPPVAGERRRQPSACAEGDYGSFATPSDYPSTSTRRDPGRNPAEMMLLQATIAKQWEEAKATWAYYKATYMDVKLPAPSTGEAESVPSASAEGRPDDSDAPHPADGTNMPEAAGERPAPKDSVPAAEILQPSACVAEENDRAPSALTAEGSNTEPSAIPAEEKKPSALPAEAWTIELSACVAEVNDGRTEAIAAKSNLRQFQPKAKKPPALPAGATTVSPSACVAEVNDVRTVAIAATSNLRQFQPKAKKPPALPAGATTVKPSACVAEVNDVWTVAILAKSSLRQFMPKALRKPWALLARTRAPAKPPDACSPTDEALRPEPREDPQEGILRGGFRSSGGALDPGGSGGVFPYAFGTRPKAIYWSSFGICRRRVTALGILPRAVRGVGIADGPFINEHVG